MNDCKSPFARQRSAIGQVWSANSDACGGIEFVVRLVAALLPFLFPLLYLRQMLLRRSPRARRTAVECYAAGKVIFLVLVLFEWIPFPDVATAAAIYLFLETVGGMLGSIFLNDVWPTVSMGRLFLLTVLNYCEAVVLFALSYWSLQCVQNMSSVADALYFSIITSTTVGYGDMYPNTPAGRILVMSQVLLMALFFASFLSSSIPKREPVPPTGAGE